MHLSLIAGWTNDVGVGLAAASAIRDGMGLYVDVHYYNPPLHPFLVAGLLSIWDSVYVVGAAAFVLNLVSTGLVFAIGSRYSRVHGVVAALLFYIGLVPYQGYLGQLEAFLLPLVIGAGYLFVLARERRSVGLFAGSGLLAGSAIAMRVPAVLLLGGLALALVVDIETETIPTVLRDEAALTSGAAILPAAVVLWAASSGVLDAMFYNLFGITSGVTRTLLTFNFFGRGPLNTLLLGGRVVWVPMIAAAGLILVGGVRASPAREHIWDLVALLLVAFTPVLLSGELMISDERFVSSLWSTVLVPASIVIGVAVLLLVEFRDRIGIDDSEVKTYLGAVVVATVAVLSVVQGSHALLDIVAPASVLTLGTLWYGRFRTDGAYYRLDTTLLFVTISTGSIILLRASLSYFLLALPFAALMGARVAHPIRELATRRDVTRYVGISAVVVAVLSMGFMPALAPAASAGSVQPDQQVAASIDEHSEPGDELLVLTHRPVLYYLSHTVPATSELWYLPDNEGESYTEAGLNETIRDGDADVIVLESDTCDLLLGGPCDSVRTHYEAVRTFERPRGNVTVYSSS